MADGVYVEAKRSAIGGVAQVPFWIYGMMLALGWNEIYAVASSPFYFMVLVLAAVLGYVVYTLNLWGPIYRVGNAMIEQGVEVGKERLRDILLDGQQRGQATALGARKGEDIGLDTLDRRGKKSEERETKEG